MRRIILLLGSYERGISNDHIGRLHTDYNDGGVGVDVGHHTVFCDEHLFPDHNDIGGLALPPTRWESPYMIVVQYDLNSFSSKLLTFHILEGSIPIYLEDRKNCECCPGHSLIVSR